MGVGREDGEDPGVFFGGRKSGEGGGGVLSLCMAVVVV